MNYTIEGKFAVRHTDLYLIVEVYLRADRWSILDEKIDIYVESERRGRVRLNRPLYTRLNTLTRRDWRLYNLIYKRYAHYFIAQTLDWSERR